MIVVAMELCLASIPSRLHGEPYAWGITDICTLLLLLVSPIVGILVVASPSMSGCAQGKAKVFVYDSTSGKTLLRVLQGKRLKREDLRAEQLYFLESRNNKQQGYHLTTAW